MKEKPYKIDFHIHLAKEEEVHPWAHDWMSKWEKEGGPSYNYILSSPENFREFLKKEGIDYAVVLAEISPITTGITTNESVSKFCETLKDCVIPFCNINPYLLPDPKAELIKCVKELDFKGIKLYPSYQQFYPNDSRIYPIYETAVEFDIPVMIHTGSSIFKGSRLKYADPILLDDVAVDFPELKILMVHGGRGFWYDRAFFLAQLHKNFYLEISGLPPSKLLEYFPNLEKIADKVVFGSDWPGVPGVKKNMDEIRKLGIKEEIVDKILGLNARKILKI